MGNDNSKTKCGWPMDYHKIKSCQQEEKADCDWSVEQPAIVNYYKNVPNLLKVAYQKIFEDAKKDYEEQLKKGLDDYKKISEEQFQTTVKEYQKALDEYATKGSKSCDEIKNSPEYKQKLQETADLKQKQIEETNTLEKMNYENLHRDEINKALRSVIPGLNGCESTMAEEQELKNQANIEDDAAEEAKEIEGGNISEKIYNINKRFIMHNFDESPIRITKKKKNKKYNK
jgi:hypothetical protein